MKPRRRPVKSEAIRRWSGKTEIGAGRFIGWLDITASKFYDWRERYGKVNEHNCWVPRHFWLEDWEKQAIIGSTPHYGSVLGNLLERSQEAERFRQRDRIRVAGDDPVGLKIDHEIIAHRRPVSLAAACPQHSPLSGEPAIDPCDQRPAVDFRPHASMVT